MVDISIVKGASCVCSMVCLFSLGKPDPSEESSHSLPHHGRLSSPAAFPGGDSYDFDSASERRHRQSEAGPNWVVCVAGVVCIVALLLPTEGDFDSVADKEGSGGTTKEDISSSLNSLLKDYRWLHLSVNMKLVFAFVLGLVTTAVLRPAS